MQAQAPATLKIDPATTAVLLMDFQNDQVGRVPEDERKTLLAAAKTMLGTARKTGMAVIYITVGFRPGYPEVNARNKLFSMVKAGGRLQLNTPATEIHAEVAVLTSARGSAGWSRMASIRCA